METRQAARIKIKEKVRVSLAVDDSTKAHFDILNKDLEGELLDISLLGAGLLSKHFFPVGAVIKLSFLLPFVSKQDIKSIDVSGEVRSSISGGKGLIRLGIKFLDLRQETKETISEFIKEYEQQKTPTSNIGKRKR